MRKHLTTIIKLSVTLLALFLVFRQVDLVDILARLRQAKLAWVLLGFVLVYSGLVVRAFRWRLLLRHLGTPLPLWRLIELYFVANFFNSFLPSGFSGDVIRAIEASQDVPPQTAAGTVIIDRATGLLSLFLMSLAALPFRPATFPTTLLWQIITVCVIGLAGGFVVLEGSLVRRFGRFVPVRWQKWWAKLDGVLAAVHACGWRAIWGALAISVLFNLMQVGWFVAAGIALGDNIPFSYYLLVIHVLSIAILLPSVGGLGVREGVAPLLFAGAGLTGVQAVSLTLLVFAIERTAGLLGAPVYVWSVLRQNRERQSVVGGR